MRGTRVQHELVIFVLLGLIVIIMAAFDEAPVHQEVPVGSEAVFRCRHSTAENIRWRVNGTLINGRNPPPDITPGVITERANLVDTLTIVARLDYNGTTIVCVAEFDDGSPDETSQPPAVLRVQGFDRFPISLNVSSGSEAVFRCGHPNAAAIGWRVNGTNVNTSHPDFRQSNANNLIITAHPQYNSTMVVCIAFSLNSPHETSPPASLRIQGPLAAVTSLTKVGSTLSWVAPFSLDLTNIDPDIVYCVDVYNITCGGRDLVSSDCNVTDTNYTAFSDGYLYEYIVTPRSNVEGAGNGTQSQWRDELPMFSISSTRLSLSTSTSLWSYQVELTYSPDLTIPSSYTLSLEALDGLDSLSRVETTATVEQQNQLLLDVSGLESRRLWNCTIFTFGCQENSILRGEILSTHDLQNISIYSPFAGAVRVTGRYTEGSPATGVLVIVSGDSDSYYHIATRDGSDIQEATITGIAGGEYSVSVFVVEENGLPFERAATLPSPLSVEENNIEPPSPSIDYSLESTSSGVCVKCTFLDTEASECVAVVHRNLTNIESSHKFTRSGDTASGCIEGVNLEDYQIGVIGGRLLMSVTGPTQTSNSAVIIGVLIPTVVILAVIVLVLVMILIMYRHKLPSCSRDKKSPQVNLYSPAPPTENPLVPLVIPTVTASGQIYETVINIDSRPSPTNSPSSYAIQVSASGSEAGHSEQHPVYSTVAVKPQDDNRVVYAEVHNTQGAKKGITESNPDDLTKVIYSDIRTVGVQRPPTIFKTKSCNTLLTVNVPPPVPFTAENVCTVLLPVAAKWQVIGETFPLSEEGLDDIDTTEGDEECLRQMIEAYMLISDLSHTWDEIVSVLKKIGEDSLADKIFKMHVAPYVSLPSQRQVPKRQKSVHVSRSSPLPRKAYPETSMPRHIQQVCLDEPLLDYESEHQLQNGLRECSKQKTVARVEADGGEVSNEDSLSCVTQESNSARVDHDRLTETVNKISTDESGYMTPSNESTTSSLSMAGTSVTNSYKPRQLLFPSTKSDKNREFVAQRYHNGHPSELGFDHGGPQNTFVEPEGNLPLVTVPQPRPPEASGPHNALIQKGNLPPIAQQPRPPEAVDCGGPRNASVEKGDITQQPRPPEASGPHNALIQKGNLPPITQQPRPPEAVDCGGPRNASVEKGDITQQPRPPEASGPHNALIQKGNLPPITQQPRPPEAVDRGGPRNASVEKGDITQQPRPPEESTEVHPHSSRVKKGNRRRTTHDSAYATDNSSYPAGP